MGLCRGFDHYICTQFLTTPVLASERFRRKELKGNRVKITGRRATVTPCNAGFFILPLLRLKTEREGPPGKG